MDYLGNSPTTGLTIQDKNKLDGIGIEETGEISFQNGIIVNGGTTELKTIQLEVEDDILKINRDSSANKSGITIRNSVDGKHSNILNNAGTWSFVSNASTETETNLNLAPIKCGSINSINVQEFFDNFQLHRNDGLYHAPLLDDNVSQESIWSSSKVSQELLTNAQASTSQLNNFVNNTYTPFQNSTNAHISDDDKHREINDVLTSTTGLWSSNKINSVTSDINNDLDLHTTNNIIHAELDDTQTTEQTLWSSQKVQTELTNNANASTSELNTFKTLEFDPFQNTTTNHIADAGKHREILDNNISTTSLWSSDKISDYVDEKTAIKGLSSIESGIISDAYIVQNDYRVREAVVSDGDILYIAGGNSTQGTQPVPVPGLDTLWEDVYIKRIDFTKSPPVVETFIFQVELKQNRYYNNISRMQIAGKYLVVSVSYVSPKLGYPQGSGNGLHFFDISNKSSPLVTTYVPSLTIYDNTTLMGLLLGRYLYVLLNTNLIKIYDFLQPNPIFVGQIAVNNAIQLGTIGGINADSNYIIAYGSKGYQAFSLENPSAPTDSGTVLYNNLFNVPFSYSFKLYKDGSEIYLGYGTNSQDLYLNAQSIFVKLDVSQDIINPVVVGDVLTGYAIRSISKCGKYVVLGTQRDVRVVDTSVMTQKIVTSIQNNGAFGTDISYNKAYALIDQLIYLYPFDHVDTSGLKCCDGVIGKLKSKNVTCDSLSVFGPAVIGGACSIGDNALVDGNLLVDGDLKSNNIDAGDITCQNLTCSGTQTILNTSQVDIDDPLLKLASNNTTNLVNMGIYGCFKDGVFDRYTGLVRQSSNGEWYIFDSEFEPTPTFFDSSISTTLNVNNLNIRALQCIGDQINTRLILTAGDLTFTGNILRINNILQDTNVSSFLQVAKTYAINAPFNLPNPTPTIWDFNIPVVVSDILAQNITYNLIGGGNTSAVIQIAGWYRISYSVTLMPIDDGSYCTVSFLRNGVTNDLFHNSSKTAMLRMKNRWLPMSNSFIAQMNVGDSFRPRLEITDDTGSPVNNEQIALTYFNMSCERLINNI